MDPFFLHRAHFRPVQCKWRSVRAGPSSQERVEGGEKEEGNYVANLTQVFYTSRAVTQGRREVVDGGEY